MQPIYPYWPDAPVGIGALSTTRCGGVSKGHYDDGQGGGGLNLGSHVDDAPADVASNRALLRTLLPAEPRWLTQVHGATVVDAASIDLDAAETPQADASITTEAGVVCAIGTADCLPVLLCDTAGRVVGAAHAGWRGLASGILEQTVARMRAAGADEILAWLGPAIGPQRFEVGEDVLSAFEARIVGARAAFVPIDGQAGKYLADIYRLARLELGGLDVKWVSGGGFCTMTDAQRFYSYRRDRMTGRMASLIWIK